MYRGGSAALHSHRLPLLRVGGRSGDRAGRARVPAGHAGPGERSRCGDGAVCGAQEAARRREAKAPAREGQEAQSPARSLPAREASAATSAAAGTAPSRAASARAAAARSTAARAASASASASSASAAKPSAGVSEQHSVHGADRVAVRQRRSIGRRGHVDHRAHTGYGSGRRPDQLLVDRYLGNDQRKRSERNLDARHSGWLAGARRRDGHGIRRAGRVGHAHDPIPVARRGCAV
jgi:hypothetical protein